MAAHGYDQATHFKGFGLGRRVQHQHLAANGAGQQTVQLELLDLAQPKDTTDWTMGATVGPPVIDPSLDGELIAFEV
ncbi:MAG: hypothetical protein KDC35_16840 [Acidobacteria bacterium]|nr:hypothetical protein [Acidobacteriota bacterium]